MHQFLAFCAAAGLALATGGCASVTRGITNQIAFQSVPEGAEAQTSTGLRCVTPCALSFGRKEEFQVTFIKPGYVPQTMEVKTRVAGTGAAGFLGNVLVGGVIGMGTDVLTGATLDHYPNPVVMTLVPTGPAVPQGRVKSPATPQGPRIVPLS